MSQSFFDPIDEVIDAFRRGEIVVMSDDESRENEGDLICAAELVTPESINFMIKHARGLVCVPMEESRLRALGLSRMTPAHASDKYHTAFMDSVDVRVGTTTGISAADRAATVRALVDDKSGAQDFIKPGHLFPLKAVNGGVLERAGHTEGTVDLARICGLKPAGVICEILNDDGSMMRLKSLRVFADEHGLKMTSVAEVVAYRRRHEKLIALEREIQLPTDAGEFRLRLYSSKTDSSDHLALVCGEPEAGKLPLVRVHSECMTGDVFHSLRCDCGEQLKTAMQAIQAYGYGAVVYARQEGRGIGLAMKLHAYELQEQGLDTVEANEKLGFEADLRDYCVAAQMLHDLNMDKIKLLTNNPAKVSGLEMYDVEVSERVSLVLPTQEHNDFYISTKRDKMGHII
jgi:3,4-dihydroxy 2-butanone 4-phosphate synthase/GTP cyclohydrolase II